MATNSNINQIFAQLGSLVDDEDFESPPRSHKSNYKFETTHDLLVMSCAIYRLRQLHEHVEEGDFEAYRYKTLSLTDSFVYQCILPEDYEMANKIRDHFQKKLIVLTLKGPLTRFRADLSMFVNNNWNYDNSPTRYQYPDNFIGMVYKLPYLYFYDMALQEIFDGDYLTLVGPQHINKDEKTLTHIKTVKSYRKSPKTVEFWFKDEKNNRVRVPVEEANPLLSVFDVLVTNPIKISASFTMRMRDSMQYYDAPVWKYVP